MSKYDYLKPFTDDNGLKKIEALNTSRTQHDAAKKLGINKRTLEKWLAGARAKAAIKGISPESQWNANIPNGFGVKGVSSLIDKDGNVIQSWVKSQREAQEKQTEIMENAIEALMEKIIPAKPKKQKKENNKNADDNLTSIVIGDAHFGMLAWKHQTGKHNFDTKIAEDQLTKALTYMVETAPNSKVGVLINIGDFFHADGQRPFTPAGGNFLDTDSRYSKTIDAATRCMRHAIDAMLEKFGEVWVINQRGNHDETAALWFNKIIKAYYENEPRAKIFDNESKYLNFSWGDNFVATHHGDKIRNNRRWYEVLTRDYAKDWGNAKFRYAYKGHIHHETKEEIGGMIFESFPTLAPADKWHAESGYGANQSITSVTLHKKYGEISRIKCAIEVIL